MPSVFQIPIEVARFVSDSAWVANEGSNTRALENCVLDFGVDRGVDHVGLDARRSRPLDGVGWRSVCSLGNQFGDDFTAEL
jgi:hypothetical protein